MIEMNGESTMKMSFDCFMPTRIIFGPGRLKELATMSYLPGKRALIVMGAGQSMRKHGYLDRVVGYLKQNGVEVVIFDKILPNPLVEHVMEGAKVARENKCDFIIGLGGGSPIDSSKSIAVMATNPGHYWDYVSGGSGKGQAVPNQPLPIVVITTTAGTGTEADPWTVITKSDTKEKIGFGFDGTFPVLSIVDPELMLTVPPDLTAYQGMDAFFHAVEGYLATVHQPAGDAYSLMAVEAIARFLPLVVRDGKNLEARTNVAWANTAAGMVESLSSCISHHSMEHAASAFHPELPHGAGLTALSVSYFSFVAKKCPERFPTLARTMGEDIDALSTSEDQAMAFVAALKKLIAGVGLQDLRLSQFGVTKSEIPALATNAMDTMGGLFKVDPYKLTFNDVVSIYEGCF
jgi:alcohol dehydrogenase